MRDVIAYPGWHAPASAVAHDLAERLRLRPVDVAWPGFRVDAALAVAPVALRSSYLAPTTPAVVVTRQAEPTARRPAASVVCGVKDDDDAACVAIAGALAEGLGLPLILVHVVPSLPLAPRTPAGPSGMAPDITGRTVEDRAAGRETLDRVAHAAGLHRPGTAEMRLLRGRPGATLAATARRERAAAVVVSTSTTGRLQRALLGSAVGYLLRRCDRPVVVCPRDPAAAMRVRAAVTPGSPGRAGPG